MVKFLLKPVKKNEIKKDRYIEKKGIPEKLIIHSKCPYPF